MSTLGDPLPPPLSTFVNFWRPPPPAPWVDVNKVRSLTYDEAERVEKLENQPNCEVDFNRNCANRVFQMAKQKSHRHLKT